MRHAIRTLALTALSLATMATSAFAEPQVVNSINGIGLIDYMGKPDFKVGDWASYRMTGKSDMGYTDDYVVTVLIAGEEEWWGEKCFWVETWTDVEGSPPSTKATLMSYAIFSDSLPVQRMQMYSRKSISGLDMDGNVLQEITRSATSALKSRTLFSKPLMWDVDTIGVDTVHTPKGLFQTKVITLKQGKSSTTAVGDSSVYTEVRENRTSFQSRQIPLTHIVREDMESMIFRKTWMIGRSEQGAPLHTRDRGVGSARLIDYGHAAVPRLVPPHLRGSIASRKAAAAASPRR